MKAQLLKWGTIAIVLLGVALFAAGVSPYTAKAATLQEAPPPAGTCELTWKNGGGGNIALYANYVTDAGLKQTLQDYNLLCGTGVKVTSGCILMPNSNVSALPAASQTPLYLVNIQATSPWVYSHLNGQYNSVWCDGNMTFAL
ncbi:hypothetical protein KSF_042110 [Reticulibacter mediterranei]|uniref:Uncharacterized protein n=1 Tax=Reticulibacter mediterranei TaxID=2778369 RepID=A0A8J3N3A6_9CHLR|nr:hypothetical protein [Reticulibacter mediterranei]GHO94163.1 hypothetical protein KSF_042110 [Reticulibacter mediterranei]